MVQIGTTDPGHTDITEPRVWEEPGGGHCQLVQGVCHGAGVASAALDVAVQAHHTAPLQRTLLASAISASPGRCPFSSGCMEAALNPEQRSPAGRGCAALKLELMSSNLRFCLLKEGEPVELVVD